MEPQITISRDGLILQPQTRISPRPRFRNSYLGIVVALGAEEHPETIQVQPAFCIRWRALASAGKTFRLCCDNIH